MFHRFLELLQEVRDHIYKIVLKTETHDHKNRPKRREN